jgi:hypothetical protein
MRFTVDYGTCYPVLLSYQPDAILIGIDFGEIVTVSLAQVV